MRRGFVWISWRVLFFMLVIVTVLVYFRPLSRPIASTVGDESSLENSEIVVSVPQADHYVDVPRAGARSLLYALEPETALVKPETELVVDLDGTITLRHKSERVLWSFATGSPIYSSYQAPIAENDKENVSDLTTGFFLDFWDDWTLYAHDKHHGALNLSMTAEEFVKITPHVSHDGVILGSKTTTVFVIDGKTGTLVRSYKSPYSPSQSPTDTGASTLLINNHYDNELVRRSSGNAAALPLYITRTDYKLEYFGLNSSKLLWNLKIAHFGAALLCQDIEMPLRENNLNSSHGPGSEINNDFDMPLSCQSKIDIRRQHKSKLSTKVLPKSSNAVPISQASIDGSLNNKHETKLLLAFDPDLPSQSNTEKVSSFDQNNGDVYGKVDMLAERKAYNDESTVFFSPHLALTFILFIFVLVGFVFYCRIHVAKEQDILKGCPGNSNLNAVASKRKKSRKSGKNNSGVEKKDEDITSGNYDALPFTDSYNNKLLDLNELAKGGANGRKIGKLFVSNTEIAKGSNGTIVLEGFYDGRSVAVKRLVRSHYEVAFKEIQNLIASDQHPNIVRWYGVEYDQDFVYLCLERCICSLGDLVPNHSDSLYPVSSENQVMKAITGYTIRLDSVKGILQDINLWKASGHPTPLLLKLMRDVVSGIAHLHELGIIHRDLKPQNVLIIEEKSLCAKLSDMGISKRLLGDMSSLGHLATGCGSSGWQAPEQLLRGRQTRAVDLFSLGCVLFFCITGGKHPFGDHLERDVNITKNQKDLFLVEYVPEALDLISGLLNPQPELRPNASEVLHHPLFWNSEMRLSFLRDVSDRVELEDRENESDLLKALESTATTAIGGKWDDKVELAFIVDMSRYRRYKFHSVRDLLRLMRNKLNHYRELPKEIQESDLAISLKSPKIEHSGFQPIFRSGSCSEKGPKQYMEDEYVLVDDLDKHLGEAAKLSSHGAFYGVFDGHGGIDAASFAQKNILKFIVEDSHFPAGTKKAVKNAFLKADHALADATSLDKSSGTTALTALILGRTMLIANAGDSRAVLGKRGRAVELSKDHKPNCTSERLRIEKLGGVIYDGYLNGQLSVARALGDWHIKGSKDSNGPLSCEPELEEIILTEEDEFLIMGCDGLWDVMSSQCAVTMVRKELVQHNDPELCSKALVKEALQRNTCDNLTVVVVCFSPDPPPQIEIPRSYKRRSISAEGLDLLKGVLNTF